MKSKKYRNKKINKTRKRKMIKPKRVSGEIFFSDRPEFRPNLSPRQIFKLGSFGGTYWRPIKSKFYDTTLKNKHKKFPNSWWKGIPEEHLTKPFGKYDVKINKYGKKSRYNFRILGRKKLDRETRPLWMDAMVL